MLDRLKLRRPKEVEANARKAFAVETMGSRSLTCGCSRTRSCTRLVFSLLWLYYAKYELAYPVFPGLHPLVPVRYKRMKPYNFFLEREDRILRCSHRFHKDTQVHILC